MNMKTHAASPFSLPALLAAGLLAAALAGCATGTGLSSADRLELYRSHAGDPVDTIRYPARYTGWTPLGDSALALWTRPSEAWLVELSGPCHNLDYALTIAIDSRSGWLSSRFDRIYVNDAGVIPIPCQINTIRPLDVKAIRTDEQKLREVREQQKAAAETAGT